MATLIRWRRRGRGRMEAQKSRSQGERGEGEAGIKAVLGVLLEQPGRRALPTLPSAVSSCRQERVLRAAERPAVETPDTSQIPKPNDTPLSPDPRSFGRAGPGSASCQQPR